MAWMDGDGQWMEEVAIFRTADRSQRQIYFYFGFLQQMTLFYSLVDFSWNIYFKIQLINGLT